MVKVNEKDFVEIEYVGRIKGSNKIFDLTDEELAKKEGVYSEKMKYGPVIICLGQAHLLKSLDKKLEGKEVGKKYKIELSLDESFGRKDPRFVRVISKANFNKHKVNPFPGLQVNIDGKIGVIRSVTGGRVVVDFNHPLAGRELIYEIKINRKVTDIKEQLKGLLDFMGLGDTKIETKEGKMNVVIKKKLPREVTKKVEEEIKRLISGKEVIVSTQE